MSNLLEAISVNVQSSIRIDLDKIWRFDPFRIEGEPGDADYILVTHGHFDHFSPDDLRKVMKTDTYMVIPASVLPAALEAGFDKSRILTVEPGDEFKLDGLTVKVVPAYNTNKPNHPVTNKWVGYVVDIDGTKLYVAGDTDVIPEQDRIDADIMMIPVGGTYTMDENEAADLVNKRKPRIVIPIHYGSVINDMETGKRFAAKVKPPVAVVLKL